MSEKLGLLHSKLELNSSEQLQQKPGGFDFLLHLYHFLKLVEHTEKQTSSEQHKSRKGKCLSSSCHQIFKFGQNRNQTPPVKVSVEIHTSPPTWPPSHHPHPASQLPYPQLQLNWYFLCVSLASYHKLDHFADSGQKQFLYWSPQRSSLQHASSSGCISKPSGQQSTARKNH